MVMLQHSIDKCIKEQLCLFSIICPVVLQKRDIFLRQGVHLSQQCIEDIRIGILKGEE